MPRCNEAQTWANCPFDQALEAATDLCSTDGSLFSETLSDLFTNGHEKLCLKLLTRLLSDPTLPETGQTFLMDFIAAEMTDATKTPFDEQFLVSLVQFLVESLDDSNPRAVLPDPKRVALLKPLLERVSATDVEVKFMDAYLTTSQLVTRVLTHVIVECCFDCRLYLIHVVMLLNELSVHTLQAVNEMLPLWLTNLFDRFQQLLRQHPCEVPAVFYQLCKLCCASNLLDLLLFHVNKAMHNNESTSDDKRRPGVRADDDDEVEQEEERQEVLMLQSESTCVTSFVHLFPLVPPLPQHLLKFLHRALPAASHVHLSRFVFSVCVFCLSPGASSSLVSVSTREALESVLFRNMLVLTECERVANQMSHYAQQLPPLKSVSSYVIQCLAACEQNAAASSHILEGLVCFGFALMDRFGPITCPSSKTAASGGQGHKYRSPRDPLTCRQRLCQLGSHILTTMFLRFEVCRVSVLKESLSHLFVKASTHRSTHAHPYALLLARLIRIAPVTVLDNVDVVSSWFEYLPLLPSEGVASLLFHALRPLLQLSLRARQQLLPILRKAHRSNQQIARETAASGCLVLLRNTKMTSCDPQDSSHSIPCSVSLSQMPSSFASQGASSADESNNALSFELISILRRSLSQNTSVRAILYREFPDLIQQNDGWSCAVMELLYQHFMCVTNYSKEGLCKIMQLNSAEANPAEGPSVEADEQCNEPFGLLVNAMSECFHTISSRLANRSVNEIADQDYALTTACQNSCKALNEMVSIFTTTDFPGCNADTPLPTMDWKSNEGQRFLKQLRSRSLVLQALIQFRWRQLEVLSQECQQSGLNSPPDCEAVSVNIAHLKQLFTQLVSVTTLLRDPKAAAAAVTAARASSSNGGGSLSCLFTLQTMTSLLCKVVLAGNRCEVGVRLYEEFQGLLSVKLLVLQFVKLEAQLYGDYNVLEFVKCASVSCERSQAAALSLRSEMAVVLWGAVEKQLEAISDETSSSSSSSAANKASRILTDHLLNTLVLVLASIRARHPDSLEELVHRLVEPHPASLDTTSQSNRRSSGASWRSSSLFYQLFQKVHALLARLCQGQLPGGSSPCRQTIHSLLRLLTLTVDMLFLHHSSEPPPNSSSSSSTDDLLRGHSTMNTGDEGSRDGASSAMTSSNVTSSWELKECCHALCKLCMEVSCLDVMSSRVLVSTVLSFGCRVQTCNFVTKVAAHVFYQLGGYSEFPSNTTTTRTTTAAAVAMQSEANSSSGSRGAVSSAAAVGVVSRENAEMLAAELNSFLTQWLALTHQLTSTYLTILATLTKDTVSVCGGVNVAWLEKTEKKLCEELIAVTLTLVKLLNCSFSKESSFCATINNTHHYYTGLTLLLKCVIHKVQVNLPSLLSGPVMTPDLERLLKTSQAPMKDGLHNALEHAAASLWRATEVDSGNKSKEKKNKRKLDHHQTSDDDVILSDVTAQHNQEALVTDDSSVHNEIAWVGAVGAALAAGDEKGKVQIGRETRNIPQLIFAMEQCDKSVFHLCKLLKTDSSAFVSSVNLRNFRVREDSTAASASAAPDSLANNSAETSLDGRVQLANVPTSTQRTISAATRRPGSV